MRNLKVLDIGCGGAEFYNNWLSQSKRSLSDLWYPEGADKRRFRNPSEALNEVFPDTTSIDVVGVDRLIYPEKNEKIINGVKIATTAVCADFSEFAKCPLLGHGFDVALICHPSSLDLVGYCDKSGIEDILKAHLKFNSSLFFATDLMNERYNEAVSVFRASVENLGFQLEPDTQFDTSWSQYYKPGTTNSLVFKRHKGQSTSKQQVIPPAGARFRIPLSDIFDDID